MNDCMWFVGTITALWQSMKYKISFKLSIEIIMARLQQCLGKDHTVIPKFVCRVLPWLQKAVEVTMRTKHYHHEAIS